VDCDFSNPSFPWSRSPSSIQTPTRRTAHQEPGLAQVIGLRSEMQGHNRVSASHQDHREAGSWTLLHGSTVGSDGVQAHRGRSGPLAGFDGPHWLRLSAPAPRLSTATGRMTCRYPRPEPASDLHPQVLTSARARREGGANGAYSMLSFAARRSDERNYRRGLCRTRRWWPSANTLTSRAMMTDSDPAHGGPLQQRSAVELVEAYI
jgi:hypothetical protein